jgi:hypothetical protein
MVIITSPNSRLANELTIEKLAIEPNHIINEEIQYLCANQRF